jgi:hypothetical protein
MVHVANGESREMRRLVLLVAVMELDAEHGIGAHRRGALANEREGAILVAAWDSPQPAAVAAISTAPKADVFIAARTWHRRDRLARR